MWCIVVVWALRYAVRKCKAQNHFLIVECWIRILIYQLVLQCCFLLSSHHIPYHCKWFRTNTKEDRSWCHFRYKQKSLDLEMASWSFEWKSHLQAALRCRIASLGSLLKSVILALLENVSIMEVTLPSSKISQGKRLYEWNSFDWTFLETL